jgi:hypothetical protein
MENYISIRIYIKDGKLEQVVPERPWEGQVDAQVIYHDEYLEMDDYICKDEDCPETIFSKDGLPPGQVPDFHYHDYFSTAVIRAESR